MGSNGEIQNGYGEILRDGKGHPETQKTFIHAHLKFYRNFRFFHNAISPSPVKRRAPEPGRTS